MTNITTFLTNTTTFLSNSTVTETTDVVIWAILVVLSIPLVVIAIVSTTIYGVEVVGRGTMHPHCFYGVGITFAITTTAWTCYQVWQCMMDPQNHTIEHIYYPASFLGVSLLCMISYAINIKPCKCKKTIHQSRRVIPANTIKSIV